MYTQQQVRTFRLLHLQTGCWYLECKANFCPSEEEEEKVRCGGELPTQDLDAEATASGKEATAITVASGKGKRQRNSVGVEDSGSKPKKSRAKKDSSDVPHVSSATVNPPFQSSQVRARSAITSNPFAPSVRSLVLNDCLQRFMEEFVKVNAFPAAYKEVVKFISEVSICKLLYCMVL